MGFSFIPKINAGITKIARSAKKLNPLTENVYQEDIEEIKGALKEI